MLESDYKKMDMYGQYVVPSSDVMVNLGVGQPRNSILSTPVELMKKYMKEYSNEDLNCDVLQYGDIPGYLRFRYILSKFLNRFNYKSKPEHFFQTNGATEAVSLIATLFSNNDDILVVENPTYFLMINIFKEMGRRVIGINMDNDGFKLDELRSILNNNLDKRVLFYGIPFNHNPTGISWSVERKLKLCELLDKYENLTVMTDEVYQLLNFENMYHTPLAEYHNRILTVSSFSKVIAPAFRIGWIYTKNSDYISKLKLSSSRDSTGGNNVISSLLVERMIINGDVDSLLKSEKLRLGMNLDYVLDYLDSNISKYFDYNIPNGGYFLWLRIKDGYNIDITNTDLMNNFRVKYHNGKKFSINNDFGNYIRLSLSFYTKEEILLGLERLYDMMESLYEVKDTNKDKDKNRIGIFGSNGRLGKLIMDECKSNKLNYGVVDFTNLDNIASYNCIIDVTSSSGTRDMIIKLLDKKIYLTLIIGTTGHDKDIFRLFSEYGKYGVIYYLSNFSTGIRMLKDFIKSNNKSLSEYNVNIEETHHIHKKDAPSGTAISLSECFKNNEVKIKSKREGEVFGEHKIVISNESEEITIIHKAVNRELFSKGCINFVKELKPSEPKFIIV